MVTDVLLAVKGEVRLSKNIGGQYWGSTGIRERKSKPDNMALAIIRQSYVFLK